MKRNLLVVVCSLLLFSTILFSQEKVLTFNAFGAATNIESIKATNMMTGRSITVTGTNTIILSSISTDVNLINEDPENAIVYPNPFRGQTTLQFNSLKEDDINVLLINSMGQIIASVSQKITIGVHKFQISGNSVGVYNVVIVSSNGRMSHKLICLNDISDINRIEYVGFSRINSNEKSQEINEGELIHFEISSGNYTTIIADRPLESKTYEVEFIRCQDKTGMNYKVVQIGNQWWMAENLAYLPKVSSPVDGSFTEPFYYVYDYAGISVNNAKATDEYQLYGVLYNWDAANVSCPEGWHLPSDTEWEQLAEFINIDNDGAYNKEIVSEYEGWWNDIGNHLKSNSGWNQNGTDNYGFTGIPCGFRAHSGVFGRKDSHVFWWSATEYYNSAWTRELQNTNSKFLRVRYDKYDGFSVRCVKD